MFIILYTGQMTLTSQRASFFFKAPLFTGVKTVVKYCDKESTAVQPVIPKIDKFSWCHC